MGHSNSYISGGTRRMQEKMAAAAIANADVQGDMVFVSPTGGNDGNSGDSPRHALATLNQAISTALAGDTIILEPGGAETLTAGLTLATDHIRIVCPVDNPFSGYTLTGAGTLDLLTVTGADCEVSGVVFKRSAGAGSTTAGVVASAAADRLLVENCVFDYSDLTSSWTNYGVELTDANIDSMVKGCHFRDCHRGVMFTNASGNTLGTHIEDCEFWVGQATAFGVHASPTGTVRGLLIRNCIFQEADGDGSSATDVWDGSDGTNAASGPILMGANCDQYLIKHCHAQTALDRTFTNIQAINAGASGDIADCGTAQGGSTTDIYSDTTVISSDTAVIEAWGLSATASDAAAIEADATTIASDTAVIEAWGLAATASDAAAIEAWGMSSTASDCAQVESDIVIIGSDVVHIDSDVTDIQTDTTNIYSDTTIIYSDTTIIYSDTTVISSDTAAIETDAGTAASDTAVIEAWALGSVASDTAAIEADATTIASDTAVIEAWGMSATASDAAAIEADATTIASDTAVIEAWGLSATASDAAVIEAWGLSATASDAAAIEAWALGSVASDTAAIETDTGNIYSDTTIIYSDTTVISSDTAAIETDTGNIYSDTTKIESDVAMIELAGKPVGITVTIADTDLENDTQDAGDTICTATGGDVMIEEIIVAKDGTALTGPTNLECTTNNVYGETGTADPVASNAITALDAQGKVNMSAGGVTAKLPFILESTKTLYIHGDNAAGSSGGNVKIGVKGKALAAAAYLA